MQNTTTFPVGGKVELLKSVENLPYRKRIATAAKIGRDHKKNPQLKTLINDLRTVSNEFKIRSFSSSQKTSN
jgi:hypothetical protein